MLFLILKFLLLVSGIFVVTVTSPVHSVLLLVFTFCCAAALLLFVGVDFLAFVFILVYIGAIAVLFLFVVMMLNLRSHEEHNQPLATFKEDPREVLKVLTFFFITCELTISFASMDTLKFFHQPIDMIHYIDNVDTMQALGVYLYVLLFFAIYLLGSILLVSMIGAILYTLKHATGIRRQNVFEQTGRVTSSAIRYV